MGIFKKSIEATGKILDTVNKKLDNTTAMLDQTSKALEETADAIEKFFAGLSKKPTKIYDSVEDYAVGMSEHCDRLILTSEKEEDIKFIGGKLFIHYSTATDFNVVIDFYFQNKLQKWIRKNQRSTNLKMAQYFSEKAKAELMGSKGMTAVFDIAHPNK